jgi:hypothetical protein
MMNLMLHSLQPSRGAVNFILAQLYIGVNIRARVRFALPLVWVFNLEGTADLLYALVQGGLLQFPTFQVGAAWFIPTFYVTLLLVVHILIFWLLLRPQPSAHSSPKY